MYWISRNTFTCLTGQQPATGAQSTAGKGSRTPQNAPRGNRKSHVVRGDAEDEDEGEGEDEDEEDEEQKRADKPHKTALVVRTSSSELLISVADIAF